MKKKVHLQASESVVTNQAHHYFNFNFLIISGMNQGSGLNFFPCGDHKAICYFVTKIVLTYCVKKLF